MLVAVRLQPMGVDTSAVFPRSGLVQLSKDLIYMSRKKTYMLSTIDT